MLDKRPTLPVIDIARNVVAATGVDGRLVAAGFVGVVLAGHLVTWFHPYVSLFYIAHRSSGSSQRATCSLCGTPPILRGKHPRCLKTHGDHTVYIHGAR